ncbi:MAG: hypothetical protein HOQ17_05010 [Gemmatimonadaceae bacterium]|nr:hypothetical protein [Gemmatimonadaceae bacterium]NUO93769.1 hypothetical protein [Gemmatimonadaceae bacterium]NUR32873.1 hypothetical protein [Gemmatimonadaceae bacterium]NUS32400.1 hypothetical protein [Gemmatimonadaceae bacterium]NUS47902.1 hypothetical protein [Gemmatimonadaceae bacterium]
MSSRSSVRRLAIARAGCILGLSAILVVLSATDAHAQRVDSARVAPARAPVVDTSTRAVPQPPLSPRRAFLYSLLLPGYSQSILGRPTAGAIFVLSEAIALGMLRESKADLDEARALRTDSVVVVGVDQNGVPIKSPSPYTNQLIDVRRGHVEDWVAFIIANHLFAAADAYVGAHLWDLPSQVSLRQTRGGTMLAARLTW